MASKFKYSTIVFDLDGTLMDSMETIYQSTIKAFEELNKKVSISKDKFTEMIGWHFKDIFNNLNIIVDDVEKFIDIYKSHYFDHIESTVIYPGVQIILEYLNEHQIKTAVLTTKGQDQTDRIIDYFDMVSYFDYVMGRRNGIGIKPSADPLLTIIRDLNTNPQSTLIVGDTEMDIRCGKNAGIDTCAVTYGYRNSKLIETESPTYIINNITELKDIINHKSKSFN